MSAGLRQNLRGWSVNKGKETRQIKLGLLDRIKNLDERADSVGIDEEDWAFRYHLEEQLLVIYRVEEEYWRQRGRVKWSLLENANTTYFHVVANGHRRRCNISSLVTKQGVINDKNLIKEHIYDFYRQLLGSEGTSGCSLAMNAWGPHARVSEAENDGLLRTFSE